MQMMNIETQQSDDERLEMKFSKFWLSPVFLVVQSLDSVPDTKVGAKWVMSRDQDGDEIFTRNYLVIFQNGMMEIYDDDTASNRKVSFDLKKMTMDNVAENQSSTTEEAVTINILDDDNAIQIQFESENDNFKVLEWMKRFFVGFDETTNGADDTKNDAHHFGKNGMQMPFT